MARKIWDVLIGCLAAGFMNMSFAQDYFDNQNATLSPAEKVYNKVNSSIYTIYGVEPEGKDKGVALGSAVAIDKNILATNCHVAFAGSFLEVEINGVRQRGQLFYYDQQDDLCLVEIPGKEFKPVNIRPSSTVNIGENVYAIGNPEGFDKTISQGIISNEIKFKNSVILQTDAAISPGSSGGGLFDENGNLIGITFLKDVENGATNISFAIPTELISNALQHNHDQDLTTNLQSDQRSSETTDNNYQNQATKSENSLHPSSATLSTDPMQIFQQSSVSDNNLERMAYYGKDSIGLMKWDNKCFIAIPGRYMTPNQPITSLAIWFPETPNTLYIFSRIINADNAIKFMTGINQSDMKLFASQSYILINNQLINLEIITINDERYPVYIFPSEKNLTEIFAVGDYFMAQFFHYSDVQGMTTIKFGLDGFTEALGDYNNICNTSATQ